MINREFRQLLAILTLELCGWSLRADRYILHGDNCYS